MERFLDRLITPPAPPGPKPATHQMNMKIPQHLWDGLRRLRKEYKVPANVIVAHAVAVLLEAHPSREAAPNG